LTAGWRSVFLPARKRRSKNATRIEGKNFQIKPI